MRPVKIQNVAVYDGKVGWFHCFGTRCFTTRKDNPVTEVVGVIELENGQVIQLSTNRFKFLDSKPVGSMYYISEEDKDDKEKKEKKESA